MKKYFKKIFILGLIIFLLMQLYQPARNTSYEQDSSLDFVSQYNAPKNIETILRTSCYDCHSNNTNYPWYSSIEPGALFMANHVNEGKENLNFNEWGNYSSRKQNNKLDRIVKQIKSSEMPLSSYTIIHKNAVLNENQKEQIINWLNSLEKNEK